MYMDLILRRPENIKKGLIGDYLVDDFLNVLKILFFIYFLISLQFTYIAFILKHF